MKIQPYYMGSGRSSQALEKSFQILQVLQPELNIQKGRQLSRTQSLDHVVQSDEHAVLVIANPQLL